MLKQVIFSVSWVETYIKLVLPFVKQRILGIKWKCSNSFISRYHFGRSQNYHVQISLPYVKETLTWDMCFNPLYPELGPDLFFHQDCYLENEESEYFISIISSLITWEFSNGLSILKLINELVLIYKQYQVSVLKNHSQKLYDNFQSILSKIPLDNLEIMSCVRSKQSKFRILIKFSFNCQSISNIQQQLIGCNALLFNISGTSLSCIAPELYLSPAMKHLFYGIDVESIPSFHENQQLIDYVLELQNYLYKKIAVISSYLENRKQFIISLLVLQFATVLEFDAISYRKVSLILKHSNFQFILSFVLPLNFPEKQFNLSLHSIYHMTDLGVPLVRNIENFPYSPRWTPMYMIGKALQHILKNEITTFQDISNYNFRF